MRFLNGRYLLIPLLLVAAGLVVAACGDDEERAATPAQTEAAATEHTTAEPPAAQTASPEPAEESPDAGTIDERYLHDLCIEESELQLAVIDALIELDEEGNDDPTLADLFEEPLTRFVESLSLITPPDDVAEFHTATIARLEELLSLFDAEAPGEADVSNDPFEILANLLEGPEAPPREARARLLAAVGGIPECEGSALVPGLLGLAEMRSVTFMLDWTPNTNHAGVYIAKANGWYEDANLDVEIVEPGAGGVDQTVAAGVAHFGISVQENVIPAREQGLPVVAIAAVIEHNTSSLIALGDEGISRPGDLAGKTYGGWGGPLETALISKLVECDGGDPDTVEYAIIGNVDYIVGMEQNHYDFVWIFDAWDGIRYTEVLGRDVSFVRFIDHTDCIPDWYTPVIITSESLISDDPDLIEDFMEATARGYRYAMENPEEAAEILLEAAPELDEALVKASAAYLAGLYTSDPDNWGRQELDIWTGFERFLREAGLTESAIDVEDAFTNDFLP